MTRPQADSADLRAIADRLGLDLGDEEAEAFGGPIGAILESLEPLARAPSSSADVPAIEPIERDDPHNAFITQCAVTREGADGSLDGLRVGVKDNVALAGVPLTAGSALLEGCLPATNAPIVDRLLDAGATIVGKTNLDEFAFGPTGETSHFGPTANPRDPDYTPGGSSSGSAAAVAAGMADLGIGTDTGGSVRIPASYCGVVGFKPTLGTIPTAGVVELAGSLDTVGVLATDLETIDAGMAALADGWEDDVAAGPADLGGLRVGLPDALFDAPVTDEVAAEVRKAGDAIAAAGAELVDVTFPPTARSSPTWRAIAMSEIYLYFLSNALPYRQPGGERPGFAVPFRNARRARLDRLSDPLKQYLLIGGYLFGEDGGETYANAIGDRTRHRGAVDALFDDVDVLLTPTTPTTAFAFGEFSRDTSPPINHNTHPFNLSGHPAISLPCGEVDGLPVGLQLVGPTGEDARLLEYAAAVVPHLE